MPAVQELRWQEIATKLQTYHSEALHSEHYWQVDSFEAKGSTRLFAVVIRLCLG